MVGLKKKEEREEKGKERKVLVYIEK